MNTDNFITETKVKMQKALEHLKQELVSVRTGRANPALIDQIKVDVYGSTMILRDVASINSPEPRLLLVQPWDKGNAQVIMKAIRDSGQGLNPSEDSNVIRVPIPQLNEDSRKELIKLVHEKVENAKVSVRSSRREAMEIIDKEEKRGKISKDDRYQYAEKVQKVTDEISELIDDILKAKEQDLSQV